MGWMKFDLNNLFLLIAFVSLPIAGLMLHSRLHSDLTYLTYILLFDIIIITILYFHSKTLIYGFLLNTVFFTVGIVMHITYVPGGGISDILLSIPDFSIGFILWRLNNNINCEEEQEKFPKKINNKRKKNKK